MSRGHLVCFIVSGLAMAYAIYYQRKDMVPGYGATMGGDMTTGVIWLFASVLFGFGSNAFAPWYFSLLVGIAMLMLSFIIRRLVGKIPKRDR